MVDFKDHWQEARDVEAFANTVATEAFNHISSPVPNTDPQVIVKGVQSNWTSSCSDFQGGSTFRATCHFVGRDLHFDLYQLDTKLDCNLHPFIQTPRFPSLPLVQGKRCGQCNSTAS
ncbi:unnamed protein product [Hymenolepis diminuta]|uniref:Uncharacterized protein n=1 Tax=Hymenolepis diminuta TaxID=6216 RepID=A0A3P7A661_HYMDI|nr:unnamed protein product [Hymenolepis diminuta]